MKSVVGLLLVGVALAGCASKVTTGERVFIVPSDAAHLSNCELLGPVRVEASIAGKFTINEQIKEIKFRLRDAAASQYPTADTVAHGDLNIGGWSSPEAEQMGTVFKCFG